MSQGAIAKAGAIWTVLITGKAGPSADGGEAPVGLVFIGLRPTDRLRVLAFAAQMALDMLNRKLILTGGEPGGSS
jgi:nicotinamide mononucleotide (NMN) deamidase PncC